MVKLPYLICQNSFTLPSVQFSQVIHCTDKTSSYSAAIKAINVISGFALKPMQDIIFCHMCVTGITLWLLSYIIQNVKMCCSYWVLPLVSLIQTNSLIQTHFKWNWHIAVWIMEVPLYMIDVWQKMYKICLQNSIKFKFSQGAL